MTGGTRLDRECCSNPPSLSHLEGLSLQLRGAVRWLLSLCLNLEVLGTRGGVATSPGDFFSRYWSLLDLGRAKMAMGRLDLVTRCGLWRQLAQDIQGGLEGEMWGRWVWLSVGWEWM